jgi:hypothetical protein
VGTAESLNVCVISPEDTVLAKLTTVERYPGGVARPGRGT